MTATETITPTASGDSPMPGRSTARQDRDELAQGTGACDRPGWRFERVTDIRLGASAVTARQHPSELAVGGGLVRIQKQRASASTARCAARVLIADGQALVRAGLRVLLETNQRITVVGEAACGEEAVALARRLRPDVVLIDARLPGLDSVEATGRMFSESRVAVMLLTANEGDERIFAALRAGASGLLLKDTEPAELVLAVELLARGEALLSPRLTRRLIAELASRPEPASASPGLLDELTAREREVVALVALGLSNGEIAERLVVTPATAKTHVSRAMVKLDARDRAKLVVLAYEAGLVVPRAQAPAPARQALSPSA
jgi:DNA-binding NarL/FixJ family response regulator